jgi:hypothetical protein
MFRTIPDRMFIPFAAGAVKENAGGTADRWMVKLDRG